MSKAELRRTRRWETTPKLASRVMLRANLAFLKIYKPKYVQA